jgi:CRISPR-associated protein Csx17
LDVLGEVAAKRAWTPYARKWEGAQKRSTKAKSGMPLGLWQASAEERELELIAAHVVPTARVSFNPLLGSGGNAGNRDFSEGWKQATDALAPTERRKKGLLDAAGKRAHLKALLLGEAVKWMIQKLNAASWFSEANKLYNSGQRPFREGAVSPWAMALACEGLPFFAGGASRRLGARARAVGAFPFVTRAAAPLTAGEAGRDRAEVWAPLWERPMTVLEVVTLFSRGRAEVRGRGALTPSAFGAAVMRRGVDAGITEFRRFALGRTTSANTFEPRFEGALRVRTPGQSQEPRSIAGSVAIERLLALLEQLPGDRKVGQRWRFVGLRGHLEAAMVRLAGARSDLEAALAMLDAAVSALDRVDRNRTFREKRIAWQPLPVEWLPAFFTDEAPGTEARLALALVSSFPADRPFAFYRFGVEVQAGGRLVHSDRPPMRWVWRLGSALARVLAEVLHRRTLDWEAARSDGEPGRSLMPATAAQVDCWLRGSVDDNLLARWMSRLALFDWRGVPRGVRSLATHGGELRGASGVLCVFGLLQPLFDLRPVSSPGRQPARNLLPSESGARTPAAARTLSGLLRVRDVAAAMRFASSRYAMAGAPLARSAVPWAVGDPERLLASMLFPVLDKERAALVERWLRPRRSQGEFAYA